MPLHHIPPEAIQQKTNDEAWIGFLVTVGPIGALVGYFFGKERLDRESREGKSLSDETSSFNRGGLAGAGKGLLTGYLILGGAFLAGMVLGSGLLGTLLVGGGLISLVAAPVIGFIRGSAEYNNLKKQELSAAVALEPDLSRGLEHSRSPDLSQQPSLSHAVSAEGPERSFAAAEMERSQARELSQTQGIVATR